MARPPLFISKGQSISSDEALDMFLNFVQESKIQLYDAQQEAILEIFEGHNIILNTPTGSGKSLVATALHFNSIVSFKKSIYTSPVKALVNEKFFNLCQLFGPERVGLITGDAKVNPNASIICCTAEILANIGLVEGSTASINDIIMDEFHYYSDRDRGVAWQIPLLTIPQARYLLMSATFGSTDQFAKILTDLTKCKTSVVSSFERPVPLDWKYSEESLDQTIQELLNSNKAPIYLVNFTQKDCAQTAQAFTSINFCSKEEKKKIREYLQNYDFNTPYGKDIRKFLLHGIGIHHGGLLPKYRILVENLAQKGFLKIICGTDTLGVGVNIPIRSVVLTKLCKFDGVKTTLLTIRDFHQIAGRAGRKGFDNEGLVVLQAPEHVIENKKLERKAKLNPRKKMVKVKPPEKGFVPWNEDSFNKFRSSPPEELRSSFKISHGLILSVLSRDENGCQALKKIYRDCHESKASKTHLRKKSFQLLRSLFEKKIVETIPEHERLDSPVRVNLDLQDDFSLTNPLSLYLLDTLKYLDPMDESYILNLLSVVESILENPQPILYKQLDRIKKEKVQELKEEGLDYEDRIEELEKVEYHKPLKDFIYNTYNKFTEKHPWVGEENIRPKSIAREMYENYLSFPEYIKEYSLEKSEGLLLRYLSDTYKILVQTVPTHVKNDEFDEMTVYFKSLIKSTDSSLINEWEKMANLEDRSEKKEHLSSTSTEDQKEEKDITKDKRQFTIAIRNKAFEILRACAKRNYEGILSLIDNQTQWSEKKIESLLDEYFEEHEEILTNMEARSHKNTRFKEQGGQELVEVTLIDPKDYNDWSIKLLLNLEKSKQRQEPVLELINISPIS